VIKFGQRFEFVATTAWFHGAFFVVAPLPIDVKMRVNMTSPASVLIGGAGFLCAGFSLKFLHVG